MLRPMLSIRTQNEAEWLTLDAPVSRASRLHFKG